jgi:hypothetical protein
LKSYISSTQQRFGLKICPLGEKRVGFLVVATAFNPLNPLGAKNSFFALCNVSLHNRLNGLIVMIHSQVQAAKEFAAQTEELVELNERESVERVSVDQDVARRSALGILQVGTWRSGCIFVHNRALLT